MIVFFSFYSVCFAQYGSGLYGSDIYNGTVDATAPSITLVSSIQNPTTDLTPSFVFSSDEEGVLEMSGSCQTNFVNVEIGNNTVTLTTMDEGTYSDCAFHVVDASSNTSNELSLGVFSITIEDEPENEPDTSDDSESNDSSGTSQTNSTRSSRTNTSNSSSNQTSIRIPEEYRFRGNISSLQPQFNNASEVFFLKVFLNKYQDESLDLNTTYTNEDVEAVKRFQIEHKRQILDIWNLDEPTGYVGITTRLKMNNLLKGEEATCPAFTEYNGGLTGIMESAEIVRTQEILKELGLYSGSLTGRWDSTTNQALVAFQEMFREVMLDPWNLTSGTGYKYKTTNMFLNYFAGCEPEPTQLEGFGIYAY